MRDVVYAGIIVFSATGGSISHNTISQIRVHGPGKRTTGGKQLPPHHGRPTRALRAPPMSRSATTPSPMCRHGTVSTPGGLRITFRNNVVRRCSRGLFITNSPASGAYATDIVVIGNQLLSRSGYVQPHSNHPVRCKRRYVRGEHHRRLRKQGKRDRCQALLRLWQPKHRPHRNRKLGHALGEVLGVVETRSPRTVISSVSQPGGRRAYGSRQANARLRREAATAAGTGG